MCFVPGTGGRSAAARHGSAHGGTPGAAGERAQGGSLGSPRARGAGGEHDSSLKSPCNRECNRECNRGRAAVPRVRAAPAQGGRSLGLSSESGPARPKGVGPSCRGARPTSERREVAIPRHGHSGTRERRAPSPERGGAPSTNTRREQDGGRGRKERRTEKGSAAPRDGARPPADLAVTPTSFA